MRIEQSPHDSCSWLAATERAGIFSSTDCGQTFENLGRIGVELNQENRGGIRGRQFYVARPVWQRKRMGPSSLNLSSTP